MTATMTTYELVAKQAGGRTAEVDNALVGQKDDVRAELNKAEDADEFRKVFDLLRFVNPVWKALDYGYKTIEIANRMVNAMYSKRHDAIDMRDTGCHCRPAQKRLWQTEVDKLDSLIGEVCLYRATANQK